MEPSLASCRLKLNRAAEHVGKLQRETSAFYNPCHWIEEVDPQTGDKLWLVRGPIRQAPPELSPIIGDVLYNLRSALDHLAWQLVLVNGQTPDRGTAFPIFGDETKYRTLGFRKLRGMSDEARAEIESFQPWNLQGLPRGDWLLWLEELGNIDKHRHLNLTVYATQGGFWSPPIPMTHADRASVFTGPVEEGTILARAPGELGHVGFSPMFGFAFAPDGPAAGESLDQFLVAVPSYIRNIVNRFEHGFFTGSSQSPSA